MFLCRRSGIFYLWYIDSSGRKRKISTHASTKSDALRFLNHFKERCQPTSISLTQFAAQLHALRASEYSVGTLGIYSKTFQNLIDIVGDLRLKDLTPVHYDRFWAVRARQVSPTTLNIELRTLKAALSTAVRWRLLEKSPFDSLGLNRIPERSAPYFEKHLFMKLVSSIDERWLRDVVVFAALTGLRRGEIVNLRWADVNLEARLVHIESRPDFRTKTGRKRTVPLSRAAYDLLKARLSSGKDSMVFSKDGKNISAHWLSRSFRRALKAQGLDDRLHFHSIRHSVGSWLAQDGVPIFHISRLLGHRTVKTTEAFYAHLQPAILSNVVDRLDYQE